MTIVVDASVALKWVMAEDGSAAAAALRSSGELAAPSIWLTEAANGLWKYVARRELDISEAQQRLIQLRSAPVVTNAIDDDIEAAFRLAAELSHPVYDCLYLALALRKDTYVVTADKRFVALARRRADLAGRIQRLA
jgi:predicted nucleic acid-binding protein